MKSVNNKSGRAMFIAMTVIICLIIVIIVSAIVYYSFFAIKDDKKKPITQLSSYEINEERVNILLSHLELIIDPKVDLRNRNLVQYKDLTDDIKIQIVLEDLILTNDYTLDGNKKYCIKLEDVLARAKALYNVKSFDYFPDFVDFKNYHFEKMNGEYIGSKTVSDEEYGKYYYDLSTFNVSNDELYIQGIIAYFKDSSGIYTDSTRDKKLCKDESEFGKEDVEPFVLRQVHGTYKIVNNQFIFVSETVSVNEN